MTPYPSGEKRLAAGIEEGGKKIGDKIEKI